MASQLVLRFGGTERVLSAADLRLPEAFTELQSACSAASGDVEIDLRGLLTWAGPDRFAYLDFIASLDCSLRIVVGDNDGAFQSLFEAVLALMPSNENMDQFARAKMAALEVAALLYPEALEEACDRILKQMQSRGVRSVRTASLVREARGIADQLQHHRGEDSADAGVRVREVLHDAPISEEAVIPPGYRLTSDGVSGGRDGRFGEIWGVVAISGLGEDVARGTEVLRIGWRRDGRWVWRDIDRATLSSTRDIVGLSAYGFPVNTNNAAFVVQYLADFEAANRAHLPRFRIARQLGFQGEGGDTEFLWGHARITGEGVQQQADQTATPSLLFRGDDDGDEQIALGYHSRGKLENWREAVAALEGHPRAMLAVYASLAVPMLYVLRASNFIVDFSGVTTTGKTTALRVAASVWGRPDEDAPAAAISTWRSTTVWRERAPAVLNNLPFILDDTKNVRCPEDVANTAYMIAQGRGKGRGTVKGIARQDTFSTVMLSSGEQPVTSFTKDGGTRARVICVWGSPFGSTSPEMGQLARRINEQVKLHYGHAGPRFVQFLLRNKKRWPMWRREYREWTAMWQGEAGDNAIAGRMAAHFAVLSVTADLAHAAGLLPWDYDDPIGPLFREMIQEAQDLPAAALRHVMGWAYAHQDEFWGRRPSSQGQPVQGWAGRWDPAADRPDEGRAAGQETAWDAIGFIPDRLDMILRDGGFEPDSTVRAWKDREWLRLEVDSDGTRRTRPRIRVGGERHKATWQPFRQQRPTEYQLERWYLDKWNRQEYGMAIIAGQVSGNLEIVDLDNFDVVQPWSQLVEKERPGLLARLVRVQTPRPGMHVYYRCPEIAGNQKLARIAETNPETAKPVPKTIIETKGEGGYCLAPPSPASCHPSGKCYRLLDGKDLTMVPIITPEERAVLLDSARALNQWKDPERPVVYRRHVDRALGPAAGRPGDDFNVRADWGEILEPHGWQWAQTLADESEQWRRPGKLTSISATTNYAGSGLLYVFSTNAAPFEEGKGYTKFHAYALLEHGGDFAAAARALSAKGYGSPPTWGRRAPMRAQPQPGRYSGYPVHSRHRPR